MFCDYLDEWGGSRGGGGRRVVQEGRDVCIYIADSFHCTAESNATLGNNYTTKKPHSFHKGAWT